MSSFAIEMGEEKGYSLAAPKGAGSDGSLKSWLVMELAVARSRYLLFVLGDELQPLPILSA